MREQGWYTKDRVKDRSDKKKVTVYYKNEFVHTRQVLKEYNIICY